VISLAQHEAIAWPLVDEVAFAQAAPHLDAKPLLQRFAATSRAKQSPSRVADLCAFAWGDEVSVIAHLRRHARALLRPGSGGAELREDAHSPGEELIAWRQLSLVLPADLLAALCTPEDEEPPHGVRLLSRATAPVGGVAHLHLHAGAGYPPDLLWAAMPGHFGSLNPEKRPPDGRDKRLWRAQLLMAHLARWYLAWVWELPLRRRPTVAQRTVAEEALRWLVTRPNDTPSEHRLRTWRQALWRPKQRLRSLADAWDMDPVGRPNGRPGEPLFLHLGACAALRAGADPLHVRAFTQILRVRVALHRLLVMQPDAPGLDVFVGYYQKIRSYRGTLEALEPAVGAETGVLKLHALELRTQPPARVSTVLALTAPTGAAIPHHGKHELAWVLHFVRDLPTKSSPALRGRWRRHLSQARTLEHTLRRWPALLYVVRGLDVAGEERQGPLWLDLPLMHRLRSHSEAIARASGLPELEGLRMSVHAGEDLRSPLTALRHVDELLAWKVLRRGDRVGHGLIVGAKLDDLPTRVHQPRCERLLDVCWLLCRDDVVRLSASLAHQLAAEGAELSRELFGEALQRDELEALYNALGDPSTLPRLGLEWGASAGEHKGVDKRVVQLIDRWGDRSAIEHRLCKEVLEAALQHQKLLRAALADLQVHVELNPSSNQTIGGTDRPVAQPGLVGALAWDGPEISLSTDDPLCFATRLDDEYAYAWAALRRERGAKDAQAWIDAAAERSLRARFATARALHLAQPAPQLLAVRRWWDAEAPPPERPVPRNA